MQFSWLPYLIGGLFSIVGAFYGCYLLFLKAASSRHVAEQRQAEPFLPPVTMIIPVYNESKIIDKRIENITGLSYPKDRLEVVFVDGNSSDDTPRLIKQHIALGNRHIRLVSQKEREGYNRAIITGVLSSNTDVVVLADGGSFHDSESLTRVVNPLGDSRVGVVTGKAIMLNESDGFLPKLEKEYRSFSDFIRLAESRIDSTPDMKGELLAARKVICMRLAEAHEHIQRGTFDVCLAFQARLDGFRAIFEPNARFYEYAPTTLRDRLKVQIRRASFLVGAFLSFRNMLLRRKYGPFGTVILPAHFVMLVVTPWLVLASLATLVVDIAADPIFALTIWTILGLAMLSRRIRAPAISFVLSQIALAAGLIRLLSGRASQMIDTAASTRR